MLLKRTAEVYKSKRVLTAPSFSLKNTVSFYSDYIEMCLIGSLSFKESEQMEEGKLITKFPHLID